MLLRLPLLFSDNLELRMNRRRNPADLRLQCGEMQVVLVAAIRQLNVTGRELRW